MAGPCLFVCFPSHTSPCRSPVCEPLSRAYNRTRLVYRGHQRIGCRPMRVCCMGGEGDTAPLFGGVGEPGLVTSMPSGPVGGAVSHRAVQGL